MERIKQALEKARQERESRQGAPAEPPTVQREYPATPGKEITQRVSLDKTFMQQNRILAGMESGAFTDAYNLLRTRILQRFKERNWNTLAVTSPRQNEGKTLTAINIAISIAREVDYSVLLVDANLRQPWMLEQLGLAHRKGLSNYLTENTPVSELLIRPEGIEHLVILPGGPPLTNSAEMLSSPRMTNLVEEMKSRYHSRVIIFDLPPVLSSSDVLAFTPIIDAVLLVVEDGKTQKKDIDSTTELLANTSIVGTVLNKAEATRT